MGKTRFITAKPKQKDIIRCELPGFSGLPKNIFFKKSKARKQKTDDDVDDDDEIHSQDSEDEGFF